MPYSKRPTAQQRKEAEQRRARQRGLDKNKKEHDYQKGRSLQSKRPQQKEGETLKAFKARLDRWALKHDIGRKEARIIGTNIARLTNTRKNGQKATLNGKPVVWKDGKWISASRTWKNAHGAEGTKPKTQTSKSTPTPPKPAPKPQTTAAPKPKPLPKKKPQSKDTDANYKAWAKANPALAKKLLAKKDKKQAGYESVKKAANLKIKGTKKIGETQSQFLERVLKTPKKTWLQKNYKP